MDPRPETVTAAVQSLQARGYDIECDVRDGRLAARIDGDWHGVDRAHMEEVLRFEGQSDPGDEMIVVGVSWDEGARRGVLVSAFGADTPPADAEVLRNLLDDRAASQ